MKVYLLMRDISGDEPSERVVAVRLSEIEIREYAFSDQPDRFGGNCPDWIEEWDTNGGEKEMRVIKI